MSTTTSVLQVTSAGTTADLALPTRLAMAKGAITRKSPTEFTIEFGVVNASDPQYSFSFTIKHKQVNKRLQLTLSGEFHVEQVESTTGLKKRDTIYVSLFSSSPTHLELTPTQLRDTVSQFLAQAISPLATNAWDPTFVAALMSGIIDTW